jgi:hypothetical protein
VKTADVSEIPVNVSITLLYALHQRWDTLLKSLKTSDWDRTVFHPEQKRDLTLWNLLGIYAWHSRHHTAHITALREKMKW